MSSIDRHRRQNVLREAEGYLDLATACDSRWPLSGPAREQLVNRALSLLEKLETTQWRRPTVLFLKGLAYKSLGRWHDAIQVLGEAAQLDPENVDIFLTLGWCHKRMGRLDLAIQSLEEGLVADPMQGLLYFNLACYWSLARNAKLAVRYLSQAFDLDTNFRDLASHEPDLEPIRHTPEFLALTDVIV